ncbi:protein kinase [Runella sp. CRIBMP]|uniref:serine/threonine protein kinase n=1 Tax=Runella sp. CRIBMP TaxID=2683261 RepID=UPI00141315B7|nr:serine/threonine-protein kinase [Runella sp. CRIBMP]NBB19713.1 protein kinase [Runella sp. CRIBMP]
MIGRTLQNYHIEELLGEGGMGTVYRATDTFLRRPVAIKMLHPHLLRDATFMERFRNEAVLSAQLNHPNVATLYNFLQVRSDNVMVMELVDGMTLERLVSKQGKLPLETAIRIVIQALDGLQHAHYKGILHRDIKPANLMLTREGTVKLMDFGIARMVGSQRLTRVDRVVGTLEYMAPELLNGAEPSVQSDLYAVGVLLYELLTGKLPFEPATDTTLINQILTKKPISARTRVGDLPKQIDEILEVLLQKKPEKRFSKALELRQALTLVVAPGPINLQIFDTTPKPLPSTRLADVKTDKPQVAPTRLAGADTQPKKQSGTQQLTANLLSLEGLILLGAIVIAAGIVGFWLVGVDKKDDDRKEPPFGLVQTDTTKKVVGPAVEKKQNSLPTIAQAEVVVRLPPKQESALPIDKPSKPINNTPSNPVKKKVPVDEKPEDTPPVKEEPKPVEKEEKPKEPEHKVPVRMATVEVRNEPFAVEFTQTISSDAVAGQIVWLRAVSPIQIDGLMVVSTGARVRARVTSARPASNSQKALLAVQFEAVEAVNNQWIAIKYPEYSDKASDEVVFQQGRRINNLRTTRTTLTVPF